MTCSLHEAKLRFLQHRPCERTAQPQNPPPLYYGGPDFISLSSPRMEKNELIIERKVTSRSGRIWLSGVLHPGGFVAEFSILFFATTSLFPRPNSDLEGPQV